MLSCSKMEHDNMTKLSAESRRETDKREPRRDAGSSKPQLEPILPPLIIDGLEPVRAPHS
jgi:hypothetical protein